MKSKKVKHPKMDPHLIANTPPEIGYVMAWAKKKGLTVTGKQVRAAVKKLNNSRRKVYNYLKSTFASV